MPRLMTPVVRSLTLASLALCGLHAADRGQAPNGIDAGLIDSVIPAYGVTSARQKQTDPIQSFALRARTFAAQLELHSARQDNQQAETGAMQQLSYLLNQLDDLREQLVPATPHQQQLLNSAAEALQQAAVVLNYGLTPTRLAARQRDEQRWQQSNAAAIEFAREQAYKDLTSKQRLGRSEARNRVASMDPRALVAAYPMQTQQPALAGVDEVDYEMARQRALATLTQQEGLSLMAANRRINGIPPQELLRRYPAPKKVVLQLDDLPPVLPSTVDAAAYQSARGRALDALIGDQGLSGKEANKRINAIAPQDLIDQYPPITARRISLNGATAPNTPRTISLDQLPEEPKPTRTISLDKLPEEPQPTRTISLDKLPEEPAAKPEQASTGIDSLQLELAKQRARSALQDQGLSLSEANQRVNRMSDAAIMAAYAPAQQVKNISLDATVKKPTPEPQPAQTTEASPDAAAEPATAEPAVEAEPEPAAPAAGDEGSSEDVDALLDSLLGE